MGESCNKTNVLLCLGALDAILSDMKAPINSGKAVSAAQAVYASNQA
jgi:alanine-glyoxylate transaminase/serine-glyoxylate transaminase/serine-pyruvate transaminase